MRIEVEADICAARTCVRTGSKYTPALEAGVIMLLGVKRPLSATEAWNAANTRG